MNRNLLLVITLLFACQFNAAQGGSASQPEPVAPFGLRMGMSRAEVEKAANVIGDSNGFLIIDRVPKPLAGVTIYGAKVTPKSGLCQVVALMMDISTSVYGEKIVSRYGELKAQLTEIYGKGFEQNQLKPGSIWDEPRDWMMALARDERTLAIRWKLADGSTMKPTLKMLVLQASAKQPNAGQLALTYTFDNEDACEAEIRDGQKSGL